MESDHARPGRDETVSRCGWNGIALFVRALVWWAARAPQDRELRALVNDAYFVIQDLHRLSLTDGAHKSRARGNDATVSQPCGSQTSRSKRLAPAVPEPVQTQRPKRHCLRT
jgi:hypothetical protein